MHTKFLIPSAILLGLSSVSYAATLVSDDFSSNTITSESRLRIENATDNWIKFSSNIWTVSGGEATNAGSTTDRDSEGGLLRVFDVGAASLANDTQLTVEFTYDVGADATLYFHFYGLHSGSTTAGGTQLHNTGVTGGGIQTQYDNGGTSGGDYTGLNLKDGGYAAGTSTSAYVLTGSGTFKQTIDLTNTSIYGAITNINDLQYLTMGWGSNVTDTLGDSAISLDNFSLTSAAVPEPSSSMLLLGGLGTLALRRRRA